MPNRGFGVNPFGTGADLLNSYLDNPKNKAAIEAIITSDDRKTYTAKDLERISSRYGQIVIDESGLSGSVGGELDQVHLSHNGVEWVHVKSNCR
jgi:hypothetical protein